MSHDEPPVEPSQALFSRCVCGRWQCLASTDTDFTLPDDVWLIAEAERRDRAEWTSDSCQFGERQFVRCFLPVPFASESGYYGWGVWVEVSRPAFEHFGQRAADGAHEAVVHGTLANQLSFYGATLGLPVRVQWHGRQSHPIISFPEGETHLLAVEARDGIPEARLHELLRASARGDL